MGVLTVSDAEETLGVNSLDELERVRQIFQRRR
jgi:bifunctional N-acetylglucosamine-1-phosphate-uridyltransferase/glucosamine-1-phosphate-acetyltransferase GlmU-like protein